MGRKARQEAAHGAKADKPKGTSRSVDYRIRERTAALLASAGSVSRRARRRERKVEKQATGRLRSDVTRT